MSTFNAELEYNKRYESMKNSDLGMFTNDYIHFQVMNFDSDIMYNVTIKGKYKKRCYCDCSDYTHRCSVNQIPCKHIMFVQNNINKYLKMEKDFKSGKLIKL